MKNWEEFVDNFIVSKLFTVTYNCCAIGSSLMLHFNSFFKLPSKINVGL
jgi:hypothetical protein